MEAGCPSDGALFEEKCRFCQAVRRHVKFCAAKGERIRILRRDGQFRGGKRGRFRLP